MIVYGVYKGDDYEGSYLQGKVFIDLNKAIAYAEELVKVEDEEVDRMIEFCKTEKHRRTDYHHYNKVSNYLWKGGYKSKDEISIHTVELVK